jgi:2-polyprenyl-3-methyl-5-hydroxy-6-metoxy-1,4-benzoquinol methylase
VIDPTSSLGDQVKRQMNQSPIHEAWEKNYRSLGNEAFFEQAFDEMVSRLQQPKDSQALDIGCGICANSIRLARRGYLVSAADYSEPILEEARANVARNGFSERIRIGRQDILSLNFPSDNFDLVLCWGILMHIPDAAQAIRELARVAKPGGFIVLEEINQHAPEALFMRAAWSWLKKNIVITRTPRGYEQTTTFAGETLFWRHVDQNWLVEQFAKHSCSLVRRDSSTQTEMHIYAPGTAGKNAVHAWNRFWNRYVNLPQLAFHNVFIFQKAARTL